MLMLLAGHAGAGERWLYLGDAMPSSTWQASKVSLDLNSLRRRGRHYEIWERSVFDLDEAQRWTWLPDERFPERRSLWAIRCKRGAMALVTTGVAGSFEPRPEKLQYYVPVPATAGLAIIEAACAELRRISPEPAAVPEIALPDDPPLARRILERPPLLVDDGESEDGDDD